MQWIIENWLLVLLGGGMIVMHLFGHGHGHGRGHKKGHADKPSSADPKSGGTPSEQVASAKDRDNV